MSATVGWTTVEGQRYPLYEHRVVRVVVEGEVEPTVDTDKLLTRLQETVQSYGLKVELTEHAVVSRDI